MTVRDVVLLHGWGGSAGIWRDVAAQLPRRFRVHTPDLPGYGATPACRPYTLETLARALARAAPRRCAVAGWSLGGQVALTWARLEPRQVERLALIAATPCFVRRPGWPHGMAPVTLNNFARGLEDDPGDTLIRFTLLAAQGDTRVRQVVRRLRAARSEDRAPDRGALESGLALLGTTDLRAALRLVRQPVLVAHGSRDRLVPPAAGRYLSRRLVGARLFVQHGAAHAPFLSQPRALATALKAFFDA